MADYLRMFYEAGVSYAEMDEGTTTFLTAGEAYDAYLQRDKEGREGLQACNYGDLRSEFLRGFSETRAKDAERLAADLHHAVLRQAGATYMNLLADKTSDEIMGMTEQAIDELVQGVAQKAYDKLIEDSVQSPLLEAYGFGWFGENSDKRLASFGLVSYRNELLRAKFGNHFQVGGKYDWLLNNIPITSRTMRELQDEFDNYARHEHERLKDKFGGSYQDFDRLTDAHTAFNYLANQWEIKYRALALTPHRMGKLAAHVVFINMGMEMNTALAEGDESFAVEVGEEIIMSERGSFSRGLEALGITRVDTEVFLDSFEMGLRQRFAEYIKEELKNNA